MTYQFEFQSVLPGVTQAQVWVRVGSWQGVNAELGPVFKMSHPKHMPRVDDVPADGQSHFTSTVWLIGIVPMDRHRFTLVDLQSGHYFDELSSNLNMSRWTHKRVLKEVSGGVEVTDYCSFEPRIKFMGTLLNLVYRWVFTRRHRRLTQYFEDVVRQNRVPSTP